jgi:23S rRNA (uracil1939-C5)-methyltransferase
MVKAGDRVRLDIEKPAAGGRMVARANGQVVLVSGAIPGESADVHIDRVGKGVAFGHVVQVDTPSPDRRQPFCDAECGGLLYAHIAYERQVAIKGAVIVDALQRIGKIPWTDRVGVEPSPDAGYRMRARLHLAGGRFGFFREGSHDICDARATRQLMPAACDVLEALARALADRGVERAEADVSENREGTERALHVEVASPRWVDALSGVAIDGATGMTASSPGPPDETLVFGRPYVNDTLQASGAPIRLRRHVRAFFQGNRYLLEPLVTHVVAQVESGGDLLDLYAGVGLFSLASAGRSAGRVTAVEGDAVAAADLRVNARDASGHLEAVNESVEAFTARKQSVPATLLVDPPRTGLSTAAAAGIVGLRSPRVVYVSCDVATFARDARRLVDAGYRLASLRGFDLFPNTPHVETVGVFLH